MGHALVRLAALLLALVAFAGPARADDISAAGRGVVRVVIISFNEDGEVSDFGHGSGFAVAPDRIVTNAHVVAMAQQGKSVTVGVVPSQGQQAYRAHLVAVDPARDLALLQLDEGGSIPSIPLYVGPLDDGATVVALGYPGNVDLATARSAEDYITPLPPTRSVGIFSNVRPINGISLLLHTAQIARGNSGGPLLDQCGRVLGVNTLITHNDDGDSSFAFAVSDRELTAFLQQAGQPFQSVTTPCESMADQLRADEDLREAQARAAEEQADARARARAADQQRALAAAQDRRANRIGIAVLLLVFSLLAFGGAGLLVVRERDKYVLPLAGGGALLLVGAVIVFFIRPSLESALAAPPTATPPTPAPTPTRFVGRNICRLVPERSRVTVSSTEPVPFEWSANGCVNGRTQYARTGETWTRVLVPEDEDSVSVAQFNPASGAYVVTRYLLDAQTLVRIRALREDVEVKSCTPDTEARTVLTDRQRNITAALPQLPNERLVYSCEHEPAADR